METQAICKSRENTTVIRFAKVKDFNSEIRDLMHSGSIWGVYETENGIVAEDIWGNIHENIFENE